MAEEIKMEISDRRKPSLFSNTALILVVIALFTLAWQWVSTRQRFNEVEKSLSQKLETYQALNQQSLALAKQAEERSTLANARTVLLEQKLGESRDQQEVLQTLYDQLAENREATAVAEVEQLLTIANQQLQLVGNVKSALLALQAADKRLEPLNLPRANQLRETLALEIKNLRTLPQVDVVSMSAQLESLANLCASLPLISERQPTLNAKAALQSSSKTAHLNALQKVAYPIWDDIKNLVTIERIDKPEPPLLSADHAFYLRENLKLRLLTTRIALLQHDEASYKADLATITAWINQYFDAKHPNAIQAFNILKKLSGNNISIELPQLTESISAVNRYKLSLEQSD
ncbi:MAG: uroporphyrinogen-III C-methyltransferase [Methylotenera sp.]|uniref:uroporphyrinogen-III C-methyltransferase n=1 Tax=Methylotenera sp. TaxID=2051956 RepID=UPI00271BEB7F|nr:uroporphyrinogen-III C-methyltransferase [Methylotenera sp.]MDO9205749.1 uroporphyrinogen-III C-methyltransferase [Methylotenera sp.]MDO9394696.1 uroporphyrinogen-III C-methyltransferase [Methylotenera sp.]MDP1522930.1 uroporphyrinogen-III C-methyltransferase [Methylotenera sp.]MDP3817849.1 uroporphyrinogen-III C-methyltransferase [Methylotenera sp.]